MKSNNFKLASFNAAAEMMQRLYLNRIKASIETKKARQEKRAKRVRGWGCSTGALGREAARRRQQMAYDAGLAYRRALPSDKNIWMRA